VKGRWLFPASGSVLREFCTDHGDAHIMGHSIREDALGVSSGRKAD
jgi:hypothetical protein